VFANMTAMLTAKVIEVLEVTDVVVALAAA
jgi:hypothetical protein